MQEKAGNMQSTHTLLRMSCHHKRPPPLMYLKKNKQRSTKPQNRLNYQQDTKKPHQPLFTSNQKHNTNQRFAETQTGMTRSILIMSLQNCLLTMIECKPIICSINFHGSVFILCYVVIIPCVLHPPVLRSFESGNSSSSSSSSLSEPSASIDAARALISVACCSVTLESIIPP